MRSRLSVWGIKRSWVAASIQGSPAAISNACQCAVSVDVLTARVDCKAACWASVAINHQRGSCVAGAQTQVPNSVSDLSHAARGRLKPSAVSMSARSSAPILTPHTWRAEGSNFALARITNIERRLSTGARMSFFISPSITTSSVCVVVCMKIIVPSNLPCAVQ